MGIWRLEEARLVQYRTATSSPDGLFVGVGSPGVPQGKLWVVTGFGYMPSAAETQDVSVEKYNTVSAFTFGLLNPINVALNPATLTFIEQGMEALLLPGEMMIVRRGAATIGSTMNAYMQIVEIDLPLYTYDEPQVVKRQVRAISSIRQRIGGGVGTRGTGGIVSPTGHGTTGGGGGGLPTV